MASMWPNPDIDTTRRWSKSKFKSLRGLRQLRPRRVQLSSFFGENAFDGPEEIPGRIQDRHVRNYIAPEFKNHECLVHAPEERTGNCRYEGT